MEDRKDNYQMIGHYEIQNMIGRGFFGLVFKAVKQKITYAVRFIPKNFIQQTKATLNNLLSLESENLVKMHEIIEDKNNLYLIMEHCSEGNLAQLLTQNKLPDESLYDITNQILQGFLILFKNKISVINLKPRNVLIKNGKFKLSDFGILCAKAQPKSSTSTRGQVACTNYTNTNPLEICDSYSEEMNLKALAELIYYIVQNDRIHLLGGNGEVKQHYRLSPAKINQMESIKNNLLLMLQNQQFDNQKIKELLFNREAFTEPDKVINECKSDNLLQDKIVQNNLQVINSSNQTRQFKSLPCIIQSSSQPMIVDCRSKSVLGPKPLMILQPLCTCTQEEEVQDDEEIESIEGKGIITPGTSTPGKKSIQQLGDYSSSSSDDEDYAEQDKKNMICSIDLQGNIKSDKGNTEIKNNLKDMSEIMIQFQSQQQPQQRNLLEEYQKEKKRGMFLYQTREYKFNIGIYQFIGDAIDAIVKLDFNDNKKNVLSYILAKLYLVKAMNLRDSLVLRINKFNLELFDQFCQSSTGQYLIEYMDKNIENYEKLLHEYYSNIDFKINKNVAQQLLEKDFYQVTSEQEIQQQVQSTLEIAYAECIERIQKRCLSINDLEDYLCAALYLFVVMDCNKIFQKVKLKQNFPYYFQENNHFEFKLLKKWLNQSSHAQLMEQLNFFLNISQLDVYRK